MEMDLDVGDDRGRRHLRATARTPAGTARTPASARCRCCSSAPRSRSRSICRSWRPPRWSPPTASASRRPAPTRWPPDPRRSQRRRQALRPQRPEDVDHQRRRGGSLHRLRQGRTARSSRRSWSSARFPACSPAPKKRRWASRAAPPRAVYFDNVKVPVENVLGEIGRGHIIAFNILNLGRLKLGPFAVGGAKDVLRDLAQVRQGAQGVRQVHRRVRHDPAQAGRDGDSHLCRRSR